LPIFEEDFSKSNVSGTTRELQITLQLLLLQTHQLLLLSVQPHLSCENNKTENQSITTLVHSLFPLCIIISRNLFEKFNTSVKIHNDGTSFCIHTGQYSQDWLGNSMPWLLSTISDRVVDTFVDDSIGVPLHFQSNGDSLYFLRSRLMNQILVDIVQCLVRVVLLRALRFPPTFRNQKTKRKDKT
jgi:hypothetical protein